MSLVRTISIGSFVYKWSRLLAVAGVVCTCLVRGDAAARGLEMARCTMAIIPGARDSLNTMLLLGRPTRDTIEAGGGTVDRMIWAWPRVPAIHGQVVRVDSMLGPQVGLIRRALESRHSTEVLIVPWANTQGCTIYLWQGSAVWTSPDSSALYTVRPRPESLWVSGRPTFDAFFAVNYSYAYGPYTVGPHTPSRTPTGAIDTIPSMTAVEVFAVYVRLSTVKRPTDSLAIARLRAWVRANPTVLTRFPGNLILQGRQLEPHD